jgi:DNA-binding CsgD family transcriptional regulator
VFSDRPRRSALVVARSGGHAQAVEQLLCPEIVGRNAELHVLHEVVEDAARGAGGGTVLLGDAGTGKSRLLADVHARAGKRGVRVLHGRVLEGAVASPFGPFAEAVAGALRAGWPTDPALRPVRPLLSRLATDHVPGPTPSPLALAEALLRLLNALARTGGAALLVEDLQWADSDTVVVLDHLLANSADHGAACVVTLRPEPRGAAYRVLRRLADVRMVRLLELVPLADAAVDQIVRLCLRSQAVPAGLLEFVRERADGVPFIVEELLAGLVRAGALVRCDNGWRVVQSRLRTTVPPTVAESIAARFEGLHPRTQQVLHAAALLGRRFEWELLPRITGLDQDVVLASLREATYAQLLASDPDPAEQSMRFRHALTREYVAALQLAPERAALAARAREVVANEHPGLPGQWCGLAAELAELSGDRRGAAALLVEAGARDRDHGALATAAARLEHAIALLDPARDDDTLVAREELAATRALAGEVDAALDLASDALDERRARADAPQRVRRLELALGRALLVAGRYAEASARAARAGTTAVGAADVLQAQVDMASGDADRAEARARGILDTGELPPAPQCEAWEVVGQAVRLRDVAAAEAAFSTALGIADRHGLPAWRARALHELGTVDLLDTMRTDRLESARRAAVETGVPATEALVDFHLAEALVARGRTGEGRKAAMRAIALARRLGSSILAPAQLTLARSYAHELDVDRMEEALAGARVAAPDDPAITAGEWGRVRAMLAVHQADPEAARAALDRAVDVLRTLPGHHFPQWGLWALLHALADLRTGAAAAAEAGAAPGCGTRFNRSLLQVAAAVRMGGDAPDAAEAAFTAGVADLAGYVDSEWLVHMVGWLVAPAALAGGWGDPVAWLQAAVRWFADHGYPQLATACRTQLRDAGAPVPRRGRGVSPVPEELLASGISSREVDVLWLLGRSLSNRDIADALVLSPRTVEKHVASLLRKTGTAGRAGLVTLAARLRVP